MGSEDLIIQYRRKMTWYVTGQSTTSPSSMIVNLRMCKALIAAIPDIDKDALFAEFKRGLKLSIEIE